MFELRREQEQVARRTEQRSDAQPRRTPSEPEPEQRALVQRRRSQVTQVAASERILEEFQRIKTYLQMAADEGPLKTIAVTSAVGGEGVTTIALNTALALCFEHRVLLVDANLREPAVARLLRLEGHKGLSDSMLPGSDVSSLIHDMPTTHLGVLTAGRHPVDPSQLFRSPRFERLVLELEARFDYIIFDCPPCAKHSDTLVLCGRLTGVMLVVKYGGTRRQIVQNAKHKLEQAKARLLGTIINERRYEIPGFIYRRL